jgi:hypothetical protein
MVLARFRAQITQMLFYLSYKVHVVIEGRNYTRIKSMNRLLDWDWRSPPDRLMITNFFSVFKPQGTKHKTKGRATNPPIECDQDLALSPRDGILTLPLLKSKKVGFGFTVNVSAAILAMHSPS